MAYTQVTSERYHEMLGAVPPAKMSATGFLVGEARTHRLCSQMGRTLPSYPAFFECDGKFYDGGDLTIAEFRGITPDTIRSCLMLARRR